MKKLLGFALLLGFFLSALYLGISILTPEKQPDIMAIQEGYLKPVLDSVTPTPFQPVFDEVEKEVSEVLPISVDIVEPEILNPYELNGIDFGSQTPIEFMFATDSGEVFYMPFQPQRLHEGGGVLAWLDNQPVGCVIYTPRDGYLYFGRLSVLPEYRGQGIARALIESVEQRAVEFGFSRVQLNVRVALANMLNYYTRLGYRVVRYGTHEGYTQPTYVTMEKEIPSCPIL